MSFDDSFKIRYFNTLYFFFCHAASGPRRALSAPEPRGAVPLQGKGACSRPIDQKIVRPGAINRQGDAGNTPPPAVPLPTATYYQRRSQLVQLNGRWKAKKITYDEASTSPLN